MDVETFVVPPLENNVYLVYDGGTKQAVLIDASLSAAKVLPRVKELGLTLKFVLNTHGHHDHMADDAAIAKATGAKVAIHEADVYRLEKNARDPRPYMPTPPPPAKADVVLKEASVVKADGAAITTLHTPGHTEGSVSFYIAEANVLFTGDTLMAGEVGLTRAPRGGPAPMFPPPQRLYALPPGTQKLPRPRPPTRVAGEAW